MDQAEAKELLQAERGRVERLLADQSGSAADDRSAANAENQGGNPLEDPAEPLVSEMVDDAIAEGLRDRLAAIGRAEQRLADGSYGRSVESGAPIPDERLRADPAAELTVEEAERAQA
jgi:DnaK suppressor protein